eukprot:gene52489-53988_t
MAPLLSLLLVAAAGAIAAAPLPSLEGYTIATPNGFSLLRRSGLSALYTVDLPQPYGMGDVLLAQLTGDRREIGRAYAQLLGNETIDTMQRFAAAQFKSAVESALFMDFADWLWSRFLAPHV